MYLGIDLGTSCLKVLLIDDEQHIVSSQKVDLYVTKPETGWSEQDPATWLIAAKQAFSALRQSFPQQLQAVKSVGLSGQMHGATLLDANDAVLGPCILWNDTRSHVEAAELDSNPAFREITGNIVFPGFTAPKLLWLQRNRPDLFGRTKKILLPKDYLRLWLTGEHVSEMSDASGTSWLNTAQRDWSDELLGSCGLGRDHMPRLVEGTDVSGVVRRELAASLGLSKNVKVAGGAGDNAASAIATGTVGSGSAFVSLGTSGVLFAANDTYRPNPNSAVHAFCHALPDRWHQMGVILSASASLSWFAGISGTSPEQLTDELGATLQPPSGAMFLPYLAGERTPHNDAEVRGSFHGLGGEMERSHLTQAILEGVCFALRDNLAALTSTGTQISAVTAVGGGMNSRYWMQAVATILGLPVHIPGDGDYGGAFGAARLAMLADDGGNPEDLCLPPTIKETIEPVEELSAVFDESYQKFGSRYHDQ